MMYYFSLDWQIMSDNKLLVAVVGGFFGLAGIVLAWQLNRQDPVQPLGPSAEEQRLAQEMRREGLVASCTRTAKGRFEAAVLADALLAAVKSGNQSIAGGGQADPYCRASDFVKWEKLDTGFQQTFYWIEATELEGSRVICSCAN